MAITAPAASMMAAEKRALAVKLAKSRVKLNKYTQGSKRTYVGGYPTEGDGVHGFGDCSTFSRWVMYKVLGVDIGYNTSSQIANRARGTIVEMAGAKQCAPTEALMLPGDCVYFKGCPSHLWQVGHVEMYLGGGKCIGHGSGTGPTIKTLKPYSRGRGPGAPRCLRVIPWRPDEPVGELGDTLPKVGDEGPDVLALQKLLKGLGFSLGSWGADGEYGNDTKAAVKSFEAAHGLPADGVADVACIAAVKAAAGHSQGQIRITGDQVNVRTGPDTDHQVITSVAKGTVLGRYGEDTEDWYAVLYDGRQAYVSAQYSELV